MIHIENTVEDGRERESKGVSMSGLTIITIIIE